MQHASNEESLSFDILDQMPVSRVPIDSLSAGKSPRSSGENLHHVRMLADSHNPLPPVIVHRPSMCVIDGMHRLRAARLRGEREIDVQLFDGDERSSFVLAVKANTMHGLPLSLADRKAAASRIINFFPHWSDRLIASVTGLSAKAVATARRSCPADAKQQLDKRVGRDGRAHPARAMDRRKAVVEAIRENPGASLRQIARISGVSPETVRTVRASLARNGQSAAVSNISEKSQQRRSHANSSQDATTVWRRFADDPAFRSTEAGRLLLRMLTASQILEENASYLVRAIPTYYMREVAEIAQTCATEWQRFSQIVDQSRQSGGVHEDGQFSQS